MEGDQIFQRQFQRDRAGTWGASSDEVSWGWHRNGKQPRKSASIDERERGRRERGRGRSESEWSIHHGHSKFQKPKSLEGQEREDNDGDSAGLARCCTWALSQELSVNTAGKYRKAVLLYSTYCVHGRPWVQPQYHQKNPLKIFFINYESSR